MDVGTRLIILKWNIDPCVWLKYMFWCSFFFIVPSCARYDMHNAHCTVYICLWQNFDIFVQKDCGDGKILKIMYKRTVVRSWKLCTKWCLWRDNVQKNTIFRPASDISGKWALNTHGRFMQLSSLYWSPRLVLVQQQYSTYTPPGTHRRLRYLGASPFKLL